MNNPILHRLGILFGIAIILVIINGCAVATGAVAGASLFHDRRTTGTVVEDQSIELKINDAIINDEALGKHAHINVTSYNLQILLTGEAPEPIMRKRAETIAKQTEKVRRVFNEIRVVAPSSLINRTSDSLLTARAKAYLLTIDDFDPTRIKIVTENGVTYLFGLVHPQEAELATEKIRQVGGIQKVVKLFEYIPPEQ